MRIHSSRNSARSREAGLTLIEILVSSALLLFIILGLTLLFNQTTKAFRAGTRQSDIHVGARGAMQLLCADIAQLANTQVNEQTNLAVRMLFTATGPVTEFSLPGSTNTFICMMQSFYGWRHSGNEWVPTGYRVLDADDLNNPQILAGSLYRYQYPAYGEVPPGNYDSYNWFVNSIPSNTVNNGFVTNGYFNRLLDGVVHFRVEAFDAQGQPFRNDIRENLNTNLVVGPDLLENYNMATNMPKQVAFRDGAMPALLEVELGILEPQTLAQLRALPSGKKLDFLKAQSGKIHLFRQQIAIHAGR